MTTKFVYQFLTNVLLVIMLENAYPATVDMILRMDNVCSLYLTMPSQLTQDAPLGIGTTKNA